MKKGEKQQKKKLDLLAAEAKKNVIVEWKQIDLGSFKSIKAFASDVCEKEEAIDFLVLGGSALTPGERRQTEEGIEYMMGTLFLGHVYLLRLLEELVKKSKSRIIFSCALQKELPKEIPTIDEIFSKREDISFMQAAMSPKSLMFLWIKGYSEMMIKQKEDVSIFIEVPPTFATYAGTKGNQKVPLYFKLMLGVMKIFLMFKSKKKVAEPYLYLFSSPKKDLKNGGYYEECRFVESIDYFEDKSNIEKVMDLTNSILKRIENKKQSKSNEEE